MQIKYSLVDNAENNEKCAYFSKSYLNIFSRIYKSNYKYLKIENKDKNNLFLIGDSLN